MSSGRKESSGTSQSQAVHRAHTAASCRSLSQSKNSANTSRTPSFPTVRGALIGFKMEKLALGWGRSAFDSDRPASSEHTLRRLISRSEDHDCRRHRPTLSRIPPSAASFPCCESKISTGPSSCQTPSPGRAKTT